MSNEKNSKIAALQSKIDAVPASPKREATEQEERFAGFVNDKLLDANAPQFLMDIVTNMAAKICDKYNLTDPADIVILNNKLTYLIDITEAIETPLSATQTQLIQNVLRQKH